MTQRYSTDSITIGRDPVLTYKVMSAVQRRGARKAKRRRMISAVLGAVLFPVRLLRRPKIMAPVVR